MNVFPATCLFMLRDLCRGIGATAVGLATGEVTQHVVAFFSNLLSDQSLSLLQAMRTANGRAWRSLELALGGTSFLEKLKNTFTPAEEKAIADQMRGFLGQVHLDGLAVDRARCLDQLRTARRNKLLEAGEPTPQAMKGAAANFARYAEPEGLLQSERETLTSLAAALKKDYPDLAQFLSYEANRGESLLATAARYFFRRAVEEDARLARGLTEVRLEKLQATQEVGFRHLEVALGQLGSRLEALLDDIKEQLGKIGQEQQRQAEAQQRQGQQLEQIAAAIESLQEKLDIARPMVRPQDSLAVRDEAERQLIRQVIARYRALPEEERRRLPQLLNEIGKLEVAAGDFQAAEKDFEQAARQSTDSTAQGEAYMNAYRAALERRDWESAFRQLSAALQLDANRFAPFRVDQYPPRRILGAGGFGVVFLCDHRQLRTPVVVKTLQTEGLDGNADSVLDEARILYTLDHPSIIRLLECNYTRPATKERPFIVMPYFEGQTLEEFGRERRETGDDFVEIANRIIDGLACAHRHGVLHRDVKPANVLVRQDATGWQVKLIDFGLAVPTQALQSGAVLSSTLLGDTIAGTLGYAAPEQLGRCPGMAIGTYTDVYGFGKTCCYLLFGTTTPLRTHWASVTPSMAKFVEGCVAEDPRMRFQTFPEVAERLKYVRIRREYSPVSSEVATPQAPTSPATAGPAPATDTPPPEGPTAPPCPASDATAARAEKLFAILQQRYDAAMLEQFGQLLRQMRGAGDPKFLGLLSLARHLLQKVAPPDKLTFVPRDAGCAVPVQGRGPALAWSILFSLWDERA